MAVNFRGAAAQVAFPAGVDQSLILNVPPEATPGCLLIAFIGFSSTWTSSNGYNGGYGIVPTPAGWTLINGTDSYPGSGDPGLTLYAFRRFLQADETQFKFRVISTPSRVAPVLCGILAYSGVDQTTPMDVAASATAAGPAGTATAPSLTTTTANARLVCLFLEPDFLTPSHYPSVPAGMSSRVQVNSQAVVYIGAGYVVSEALQIADQLIAAAGATGTRVSTLENSVRSIALSLAVRKDQSNPTAELTGLVIPVRFGFPRAVQAFVPGPIDEVLASPSDSLIRLVAKISPYDRSANVVSDYWFSDMGMRLLPSDVPASEHLREALEADGFSIARSIFGEAALGGAASISLGTLELLNNEGRLDGLIAHAFDWRQARFWLGGSTPRKERVEWADYLEFARARMRAPTFGLDRVTIPLEDGGSILQRNVQEFRYTGTGGAEGDADLAGLPKPLCLGLVLNGEPRLLGKVTLLHQFHDGANYGAARELIAVYDEGIELPTDFYSVDLSAGTFTLLRNPAGRITFDALGPAAAGDTAASFVKWLASTTGCGPLVYPNDFATDYFLAFQQGETAQLGLYLREDATIFDCLNLSVAPLGFWGWSRVGKFIVGTVTPPAGIADLEIESDDIIEIERLPSPTPISQYAVGYGRCWTVQTGGDLAGSAIGSDRGVFAQAEWRKAVYPAEPDDDVIAAYPSAKLSTDGELPFVQTLIVYATDAAEKALAGFELYGQPWDVFKVGVGLQALRVDLAQLGQIRFDRFGLSAGRLFRILAMDESRRGVSLTMWGLQTPAVLATEAGDIFTTEGGDYLGV